MLNYVWLGLIVIALITGAVNGKIPDVGAAAVDGADVAVKISLGLIGVMALWLGIMRIAQDSGLVNLLARAIKPVMSRLFPEIPEDHPATGAMLLNLAANWLGLSNAATPLGLKAMEELQSLNKSDDTASNSQVLFLAMNTASITIIPATIIGVRVSAGSQDPFSIIGTSVFASTCATIVAILAAKGLGRLPVFKKSNPALRPAPEEQPRVEDGRQDDLQSK